MSCRHKKAGGNSAVLFAGVCIVCSCAIIITMLLIAYWLFWGYVFIRY